MPDGTTSAVAKVPKFKRCKISRQQLLVLMHSFEDDPLPTFDRRQALANQLGMTPRSVQIWFQNRRQRLLNNKPESVSGGADHDEDEAGEPISPTPRASDNTASKRGAWGAAAEQHNHMGAISTNHPPPAVHSVTLPNEQQRWEQNLAHARMQQPSSPPFGHASYPPHTIPQQPAGGAAGQQPFPVTAAQLVPLLRGGPSASAQAVQPSLPSHPTVNGGVPNGESHAASTLLMSALGRMMMSNAADPTIAIHHAIAMLPRAVAAGQITPGAAALLMQAVHQQMGLALSMGEQPPHPHQPPHPSSQPSVPMDSQSYPAESAAPSSALRANPHEQQSQAHALMQPPPLGPTAGNSNTKKAAPANDAMDGLLLLAACSDAQRQHELQESRQAMVPPTPIPHHAAQGGAIDGSPSWQSHAACVPSVV